MVPIRGEVLFNGKRLTVGEGTVVYLPAESGELRKASGAIQSDGSFTLTTMQPGDGAMKGKYSIVVYCYKPLAGNATTREEKEQALLQAKHGRASFIPEKYANPATSGLSDIVDSSHSGFKTIELKDQ
jgi:hypothetical protein